MLKKILLTALPALFLFPAGAGGETKKFVLYGFKIGQHKSTALKQFGKPYKSHTFPDGFSYIVFSMKDHFLLIQSDNTRPDLIWAIQIQGKSNPPFHGIGPVNLGDRASKVIKTFGKPDLVKQATDESTKKEMKGITYYSYNKSRNFSIEITKGIVTSMKILFNGPEEEDTSIINLENFLKAVQSKNLNSISRYICPQFTFFKKNPFKIEKSIFSALKNKDAIMDIFFNEKYGIISIKPGDIIYSAMRLEPEQGGPGQVYRIKKNKMVYELFFIKSYEGHVLRYINLMAK